MLPVVSVTVDKNSYCCTPTMWVCHGWSSLFRKVGPGSVKMYIGTEYKKLDYPTKFRMVGMWLHSPSHDNSFLII